MSSTSKQNIELEGKLFGAIYKNDSQGKIITIIILMMMMTTMTMTMTKVIIIIIIMQKLYLLLKGFPSPDSSV